MPRLLTVAQVAELLGATNPTDRPATSGPDLLHDGWYTTDEVAELLGVDASTLRRWRTSTPLQGPPFVRLTSRMTMYSVGDIRAWLASRRVDPAKVA
ncbi:helix-turn-helix domain-containing protein [Streptomyces sp. SL13]|uniref:Helix-turn-helix domain-containing protein n=1 Tax=Streptantibioticus silvisoli TaxID=2705255 RepID=A0AA90H5T4_9ACTN|nr:helix-turn-helix domain-containing protein [Streptantibioticus silvisoli]MDI5968647.1 helix-turn-helix domain-containing protein [Streptantibioticus silvisoli]